MHTYIHTFAKDLDSTILEKGIKTPYKLLSKGGFVDLAFLFIKNKRLEYWPRPIRK